MKYLKPIAIILIFIVIIGCSNNDYAIAKVGNSYLYKSQFVRIFPGIKGETDYDLYKEKADVILNNLLRQMAIMHILERDEETRILIEKLQSQSINNAKMQVIYNMLVTQKLHISEYEVFNNFKRMNTTIWAQHILVEDKHLADSLYNILANHPERFGELARKYSIDTTTKDNDGKLKPFPGGKFVKEFEDACFRQKQGVVGPPVESTFGYHIILVNRKEFKTLENYEKDRANIEKQMLAKIKTKLETESMDYIHNLSMYSIYNNNVNKYIENTDNQVMNIKPQDLDWSIRSLPLVKSIFGIWTYDSLYKYAEINDFGFVPNANMDGFKSYMDRIMFFMTLYDKGRRAGVDLNTSLHKEIYLKLAISSEQEYAKDLRKNSNPDSAQLYNYFLENSSKYTDKGKVGIFIISHPDREFLKLIADSVKMNKKPFKEYSKLYSYQKPKEFSKPAYYLKDSNDTLGYYQTAIELGKVGAVSDIFENSYGYNIIKVMQIIEPRLKDYKIIKNQVKNDYAIKYIQDEEEKMFDMAKEEIGVKIFTDKYETLVRELANSQ